MSDGPPSREPGSAHVSGPDTKMMCRPPDSPSCFRCEADVDAPYGKRVQIPRTAVVKSEQLASTMYLCSQCWNRLDEFMQKENTSTLGVELKPSLDAEGLIKDFRGAADAIEKAQESDDE